MSLSAMKICGNCVLPEAFPGITFNEEGICNLCEEENSQLHREEIRGQLREKMAEVFSKVKEADAGEYDAIVAFSGGKDSSYTLLKLTRDYGLNCLAVTVNNGFIPEETLQNCHTITDTLGVDFLWYTPSFSFMRDMYVKSAKGTPTSPSAIKRSSNICASCINLINNYMLKLALQTRTPIVAGGYIGGQVPKDAAVHEMNLNTNMAAKEALVKKYQSMFGPNARKHFGLDSRLLEQADGTVYLVNPLIALHVSEQEIITAIQELGWVEPKNTGLNSTNCLLNDVGVRAHFDRYGFHPYVGEIAEMVRNGLMSRKDGMAKIEKVPEYSQLTGQMEKLGVAPDELT